VLARNMGWFDGLELI